MAADVRGFFARRLAGDPEADDLAQETMVRAVLRWADSAGNVLSIPIPEVGGTLRCGCSLFPRPSGNDGAIYPDILV